jgi:hypothetical protein
MKGLFGVFLDSESKSEEINMIMGYDFQSGKVIKNN